MRYYIRNTLPQAESSKAEIKSELKSRTYLSGEPIPESLPDSYALAQNCYNCAAYDSTTEMCSTYKATVRPNYWCATWKEIK